MTTQPRTAKNTDLSRILFGKPVQNSIPGGIGMGYTRIPILYKNEDGTEGELVILTTKLFCFGVSENTSPETGTVNGHTMGLSLWSKNSPTKDELEFTDKYSEICDHCTSYIIDTKADLHKYELEPSDLKNFGALYWKKERVIVNGKATLQKTPGFGPTLYTKMIFSKKKEKFVTKLFDVNDNEVDPFEMIGKYCYITSAIKFESIFVGNKISLQVKIMEGVVEPIQAEPKRLINARPSSNAVLVDMTVKIDDGQEEDDDDDDDDDDGSVEDVKPSMAVTPPPVVIPNGTVKKRIPQARVIGKT